MQLRRVDSSMLYAVGYDEETQSLDAIFWRSGIYRYSGVEKEVFEQLLAADSIGSFMRSGIIGVYPDRQLTASSRS